MRLRKKIFARNYFYRSNFISKILSSRRFPVGTDEAHSGNLPMESSQNETFVRHNLSLNTFLTLEIRPILKYLQRTESSPECFLHM